MYEKALSLLLPYEEHFQGDHNWNFRVGYAYYYLDQEGQALRSGTGSGSPSRR